MKRLLWLHLLLSCVVCCLPLTASALNTITFNPSDPGVDKSVATWGVDTAWPDPTNVRLSFEHIGHSNVDIARVAFYPSEPMVHVGEGVFGLSTAAKAAIDNHLQVITGAGASPNLPISLVPSGTDPSSLDPYYISGGGINVTNFVDLIKKTQEYINSKVGFTSSPVLAIEPFNEPDWNFPNANPTDLNNIIQQLKTIPAFSSSMMIAPSTLSPDGAQWWYDQVPEATAGSTHMLGGSFTNWAGFASYVDSTGKDFTNPEIHSMAEIIVGADRGMDMGMVWAEVLRGRGKLIQATDGDRLGYFEDLPRQSAAAVYRAPNGQVYGFAGGIEREGDHTVYLLQSTDPDTYFNGIKVQDYILHTKKDEFATLPGGGVDPNDNDFVNYGSASHEGAYVDIDTGSSGIPALDGHRWKIVNADTGQVMEIAGLGDGATIRAATDDGGLDQLWQITRTRNGYYHLENANSGKVAEIDNFSLNNGGNVQQWGTVENFGRQWYIDEVGDGSFYIRNAHSTKYLDVNTGNNNIYQWENTGLDSQRWLFVPANPTDGPFAHYMMQGDFNDSSGSNHGTAFGSPIFTAGPTGEPASAIELDGSNDYVQLPSGLADSQDITISTWVKWDGGGSWQRLFDFGNNTNEYMFLTPSSAIGVMHFGITTSGPGGEYVLETDPLPVGEWVHLALTIGGQTGVLYLDGVPQVAGQILLDPTDINPVNNFIGESQWVQDPLFNGAISDFRIYDYALDQSQISSLFNPADADGNGIVDGLDFLKIQRTDPSLIPIWAEQYGGGGGGGGGRFTAVPEPSSLGLSLLVVCGLASNCRVRKGRLR